MSLNYNPEPLTIAVFFDQRIDAGGGYHQGLNALMLTTKIPENIAKVICITNKKENIFALKNYNINSLYINTNKKKLLISYINHILTTNKYFGSKLKKIIGANPIEKELKKNNVDIVYFISPNKIANLLETTNYITTIWDLCHRDHPEFPEVRASKEFERREKMLKSILNKAVAVISDSELGTNNINEKYGVSKDRIHVIPFSPSQAVYKPNRSGQSIRDKYKLNVPYIFYPAQFWAHKNHVYLLRGLQILEQKYGHQVGAILPGGDKGNLNYVVSVAKKLNLIDRVIFPGFVPNEEIPSLYQQSLALVMPTYFGPTNLPPLEAFTLKVPVLYSDLPGLRDQVGDAALLMDLDNPETMAVHLSNLISDTGLRDNLVQKGSQKIDPHSEEKALEILVKILKDFNNKRICWGIS